MYLAYFLLLIICYTSNIFYYITPYSIYIYIYIYVCVCVCVRQCACAHVLMVTFPSGTSPEYAGGDYTCQILSTYNQ
jgi:hypothetical protein